MENCLTPDDYRILRKTVQWNIFSDIQTERAIKSSLYTVIAVENGQTVGMGRLIGDGMYYMIADVIVKPSHQGKGIGTSIVGMLTEYAEKQTPPGGRTSIQLIAEKGKEAFYTRLGFKVIPHDHCGSGMRMVIYK